MAIRSGFFNSVNGDRKYDARDVSRLFDGMITDGVFLHWGNHFAMEPASSGLSVIVKSGRCWFNHAWVENDSNYTATFSMADPALARTDAIVVEIDERDEYRRGTIKIIKGTAGSGNPTITKTEQVHQYVLAYVTIPAAATKLTASAISIKVGQGECPYAAGILDRVPIDEIWAQWNASFNEWFNSAKNTFSTEWAGLKTQFNTEWAGLKNKFNTEWQERKDEYDAWFEALQNEITDNVAVNLNNKIDKVNADLTARINALSTSVDNTINMSINGIMNPNSSKYIKVLVTDIFTESGTFFPRGSILPVTNSDDDFIRVMCVGSGGDGGNGSSGNVNSNNVPSASNKGGGGGGYGGTGGGGGGGNADIGGGGGGGGGGGYIKYGMFRLSTVANSYGGVPITVEKTGTSFGTYVSAEAGSKGGNGEQNASSVYGGKAGVYSGGGGGGGGQYSGGGGGGGCGSSRDCGGGGGGAGGADGGAGNTTDGGGKGGRGLANAFGISGSGGSGNAGAGAGGSGAAMSSNGLSAATSITRGQTNVVYNGVGTISSSIKDFSVSVSCASGTGGSGMNSATTVQGVDFPSADPFKTPAMTDTKIYGGYGGSGNPSKRSATGGGGGGSSPYGSGGDGGSAMYILNSSYSGGGGGGGGYGGKGGYGGAYLFNRTTYYSKDGTGYGSGGGGGVGYLSAMNVSDNFVSPSVVDYTGGRGRTGIIIAQYYAYILKGESGT